MRRALRIAYVCSDRGVPVGGTKGASLHVSELVRALVGCGAEVTVLASRVAEKSTSVAAPTVDIGAIRGARRIRESLVRPLPGMDPTPDAVEAAALLQNQELGRTLEKLHKAAPFDAIYERYSLWSHAAAAFARVNGIPFLLEANAPLVDEQKRYRDLANEPLARSLERWIVSGADRVLIPSAALVPWVVAQGCPAERIEVIPNAADPSRFRPKRSSRRSRDECVIGFVGSLKPWHGLTDLPILLRRLLRSYAGYRLLVVGDGPMRGAVEEQLRSSKLADFATFTGAAQPEEVPGLLARIDIALAPYPADAPGYFSPIKIFEYMSAGLPIVASRIGQIEEVLTHRRTGMLHRPGRIAEMADAIEELRRKPALAERIAREARRTAVRRYTWKRNATRVLKLVDLLGRSAASEGASAEAPSSRRKVIGKTSVVASRPLPGSRRAKSTVKPR